MMLADRTWMVPSLDWKAAISSATGAHMDGGHLFLTRSKRVEKNLHLLLKTGFMSTVSDCLNNSYNLLIIRLYLRNIPSSILIPRSRARTGNVRDRDFKQNKFRFSGD